MTHLAPVALAYGDGIGPEIMQSVVAILQEAGAGLEFFPLEIGEKVYLQGEPAGITPASWEILRSTKAFLKAPITTPQGRGFKSLNVTIRAGLGLFANIRPCRSYMPFVKSLHPKIDLVIVRENEEDLYTGVEYAPVPGIMHAIKTISRDGCERIIRYSFEYARSRGRKKITCLSKDNILKMTDGLFHTVFDEIASQYPEIEKEHWIIDIGAAKMADTPEAFDVIVTLNLYGDILSDIAAQLTGSVGLVGSANIGANYSMFEAIHGSAPRRAGQNLANPSGLLMAGCQMLEHLGQGNTAQLIYNAWARTLEEGIHTYDIFKDDISKEKVGTREFTKAICARLGKLPTTLPAYQAHEKPIRYNFQSNQSMITHVQVVGVDFFITDAEDTITFVNNLKKHLPSDLELQFMATRGSQIWPNPAPEIRRINLCRCRLISKSMTTTTKLLETLTKISKQGFEPREIHFLYNYDGCPGYTLGSDQQ